MALSFLLLTFFTPVKLSHKSFEENYCSSFQSWPSRPVTSLMISLFYHYRHHHLTLIIWCCEWSWHDHVKVSSRCVASSLRWNQQLDCIGISCFYMFVCVFVLAWQVPLRWIIEWFQDVRLLNTNLLRNSVLSTPSLTTIFGWALNNLYILILCKLSFKR